MVVAPGNGFFGLPQQSFSGNGVVFVSVISAPDVNLPFCNSPSDYSRLNKRSVNLRLKSFLLNNLPNLIDRYFLRVEADFQSIFFPVVGYPLNPLKP
jgi:hypothetical protein